VNWDSNDETRAFHAGWKNGIATGVLGIIFVAAVLLHVLLLASCAHPQYIPDPVSMELWTDAPGEPDPLEACHRVTGPGACVVMSARALAFWMSAWVACEKKLEDQHDAEN